jgi:hypothetical protein
MRAQAASAVEPVGLARGGTAGLAVMAMKCDQAAWR